MTTTELIDHLRRLDPDGTMHVAVEGYEDAYHQLAPHNFDTKPLRRKDKAEVEWYYGDFQWDANGTPHIILTRDNDPEEPS